MNQEKIGKFIAQCRKEKNITQEELAFEINTSPAYICNIERGKKKEVLDHYSSKLIPIGVDSLGFNIYPKF